MKKVNTRVRSERVPRGRGFNVNGQLIEADDARWSFVYRDGIVRKRPGAIISVSKRFIRQMNPE